MLSIENKVKNYILTNKMLYNTHTVYVATSGGADSMALLAFMNKFKEEFNIKIKSIHINHKIRKGTAERDEEFVKKYCRKNNIDFVTFNPIDENILIPENPSEEWARNLRYTFFNKISDEGIKIATAHTLTDQTETFLFRLARGTGLNGLKGIPQKRDFYIRPFLCIERKDTENLTTFYNTGYITDESNLTDDYTRNIIRRHIVPVFREINENFDIQVNKTCNRISQANEYIKKIANEKLNDYQNCYYPIEIFLKEDNIIVEEMLYQILNKYNFVNERYIDLINNYIKSYKSSDKEEILGEVNLNNNISVLITTKYISIKSPTENKKIKIGNNKFGNWGHGIIIKEINNETFKKLCKNKKDLAFFADAKKLNLNDLIITSRIEGDKFKPACREKNKIGNYMNKLSFHERNEVPLVRNNNEIIYYYNLGFTDGYTPNEESTTIYQFLYY